MVYDGYGREDTSRVMNNDEGGSGNQLDDKCDVSGLMIKHLRLPTILQSDDALGRNFQVLCISSFTRVVNVDLKDCV